MLLGTTGWPNIAALFKAQRPFDQCAPLGTLHNLDRLAEVDEPGL